MTEEDRATLATLRASLRTYRCLAGLHNARFQGRPFDLDRASYDVFLRQAQDLLGAVGLQAVVAPRKGQLLAHRIGKEEGIGGLRHVPDDRLHVIEAAEGEPAFMTLAAAVFVGFAIGAVVGGLAVYARFVGF